jgi:hypothetical protein
VFAAAQALASSFGEVAVNEYRLEPSFFDSSGLYLRVRVLRI